MAETDTPEVPDAEKCPFGRCGGSPAGVMAGVCLMCLAYSSVPLEMAVEEHDDEETIEVPPYQVAEVLDALRKFEAEIARLRKESDGLALEREKS